MENQKNRRGMGEKPVHTLAAASAATRALRDRDGAFRGWRSGCLTPLGHPACDITVQYGASWFLTVNDMIKSNLKANYGNNPVSFRVIMRMTNMDPASLEDEGERAGQPYNNFVSSYEWITWNHGVTTSGPADSRSDAGCRLTFKRTGEVLEGRSFVGHNNSIVSTLTASADGKTLDSGGTTNEAVPITYVFKTVPVTAGSVGRG